MSANNFQQQTSGIQATCVIDLVSASVRIRISNNNNLTGRCSRNRRRRRSSSTRWGRLPMQLPPGHLLQILVSFGLHQQMLRMDTKTEVEQCVNGNERNQVGTYRIRWVEDRPIDIFLVFINECQNKTRQHFRGPKTYICYSGSLSQ